MRHLPGIHFTLWKWWTVNLNKQKYFIPVFILNLLYLLMSGGLTLLSFCKVTFTSYSPSTIILISLQSKNTAALSFHLLLWFQEGVSREVGAQTESFLFPSGAAGGGLWPGVGIQGLHSYPLGCICTFPTAEWLDVGLKLFFHLFSFHPGDFPPPQSHGGCQCSLLNVETKIWSNWNSWVSKTFTEPGSRCS